MYNFPCCECFCFIFWYNDYSAIGQIPYVLKKYLQDFVQRWFHFVLKCLEGFNSDAIWDWSFLFGNFFFFCSDSIFKNTDSWSIQVFFFNLIFGLSSSSTNWQYYLKFLSVPGMQWFTPAVILMALSSAAVGTLLRTLLTAVSSLGVVINVVRGAFSSPAPPRARGTRTFVLLPSFR